MIGWLKEAGNMIAWLILLVAAAGAMLFLMAMTIGLIGPFWS